MFLIVKRPALPAGGWGYLEEEAGDEFDLAPQPGPARAALPVEGDERRFETRIRSLTSDLPGVCIPVV